MQAQRPGATAPMQVPYKKANVGREKCRYQTRIVNNLHQLSQSMIPKYKFLVFINHSRMLPVIPQI